MRTLRLAKYFENKYSLVSEASLKDIMNDVKRDLLLAYNNYVNSDTAKEPVFAILANLGEPFSKTLVSKMEDIVANIDKYNPEQLFTRINFILGMIHDMKTDPEKKVRNSIHDSIRVSKESERNYREHLKSKFEMVVSRVSSMLEKQARILRKFLPEETELMGGRVEPERKQLSKQKLLNFSMSPAAQKYGLDSIDVLEKMLVFPELRQKLTTLINAIDRGHIPIDGPEVEAEAKTLMENYKNLTSKINADLLESEVDKKDIVDPYEVFRETPGNLFDKRKI